MKTLKIFSQRLQHFDVEFHAASHEFGAVAFVVAHVEPFHLQRDIRIQHVASRKLSGDALHLLELMEMIHWRRHEILVEHLISAGRQIDILAIPGRAFVKRFDHEKINRSTEICCRGAIVLRQNFRRLDGFEKVLVEHLSPVGEVPTHEYVFELHEGGDVSHVNFLRSAEEVVDRFINHKLDAELARILVDFGLLFVGRRVALQLVDIAQRHLFGPCFLGPKEWHFLIDRCHGRFEIEQVNLSFLSKV